MAAKFGTMTAGFDRFTRNPEPVEVDKTYDLIHDNSDIFNAYINALGRIDRRMPPSQKAFTKIVAKKIYSVSSKIIFVMRNLWSGSKRKINSLYMSSKNRSELVATFLAVLELVKANRVKVSGENEDMEVELIKEKKK